MQQGQIGTEFGLNLLFYNFPLCSEFFINIDKYAKIDNYSVYQTIPMSKSTIS